MLRPSRNAIVIGCYFMMMACAHAETPALYEETIDPDEGAELASIVRDLRSVQEKIAPLQRGFHSKSHGCLSGEFKVLDSRPDITKEGLFRETKTYPVVMHFSNGSRKVNPDRKGDARGVAVKVFNVPGPKLLVTQSTAKTQDFLMNNVPATYTADPRQFADFIMSASEGTWPSIWFLITHPIFAKRAISHVSRPVESLVLERYWSASAFRLGEKAMKYNIRSCGAPALAASNRDDPDYLSKNLAAYASEHESCWELGLQIQTDPERTPIEDTTVEWTEELTPTLPVARLVLPKQDINDPEVQQACRALTFTPWHATEDHRPLGKVNRVRRPTYAVEQKLILGGQDPVEPNEFPIKKL